VERTKGDVHLSIQRSSPCLFYIGIYLFHLCLSLLPAEWGVFCVVNFKRSLVIEQTN
jgi:hypothetical protein